MPAASSALGFGASEGAACAAAGRRLGAERGLFQADGVTGGVMDPADADAIFAGNEDGDDFGAVVAGAGDMDGDGLDDVLIGAPRVDDTTERSVGAVYLFLGTATGLVEATDLIGSAQIQGRASLGGNLCNASPAADTVPAMIALGATCSVVGPDGTREVSVAEVSVAPGQTSLAPGEVVTEIRIPAPAAGSADAYLRLIPRSEMDIAVVGAGACVTLDAEGVCRAARVALGARRG